MGREDQVPGFFYLGSGSMLEHPQLAVTAFIILCVLIILLATRRRW